MLSPAPSAGEAVEHAWLRAWSIVAARTVARHFARAGKWRRAARAYELALICSPTSWPMWIQLGHARKEAGDLERAETAYVQAGSYAKGSPEPSIALGNFFQSVGRLNEAKLAFQRALSVAPERYDVVAELHRVTKRSRQHDRRYFINSVFLGTTGLCNASCVHCPTGKSSTKDSPRVPMKMDLFERLVRELSDEGYEIRGQVSFGLFGDGLLDPFVIPRAQMLRRYLPDTALSVNTNGAAYSRSRHRELREHISVLALHIESLDPATYSTLMAPLRLDRVLPKIDQIMEDFAGKVRVSVPLSSMNQEDFPAIKKYFEQRGAVAVYPDPLSSRCATDRSTFDRLAIRTEKYWCDSRALEQLVVDCDGEVLLCCNDFARREPVGDVRETSIRDLLDSSRRSYMSKLFATGQIGDLSTCRSCYISFGSSPDAVADLAARDTIVRADGAAR